MTTPTNRMAGISAAAARAARKAGIVQTPARTIQNRGTGLRVPTRTALGDFAKSGGKLSTPSSRVEDFLARLHEDPDFANDVQTALDNAQDSLPASYVNVPGFGMCWRPVVERRYSKRPFTLSLVKSGAWATSGTTTLTLASTWQDIEAALTAAGHQTDDIAFVLEGISLDFEVTDYDNVDANTDTVADTVVSMPGLSRLFGASALVGFTVDGDEMHPAGQSMAYAKGSGMMSVIPTDPIGGGDVAGIYLDPDRLSTSTEFALAAVAPASAHLCNVTCVAQLVIRPVPQLAR